MRILSAILYFFSRYPFLSFPVIILLFLFIAAAIAQWRKQPLWYLLAIAGLLLAPVNAFFGHFMNSLFLNAVGVEGTGYIVQARQTNDMLNNQYVWAYDVVLKTQDGRDVPAKFNTWTACIYPLRNQILIPPQGEPFVVKYVPGFERNFVIMSDESEYGRQRLIERDLEPVEKAAAQLKVSPDNPAFIDEYRKALQTFLAAHRNDADPDMVRGFEEELNESGPSADK
ncbi:MAG: hypothetical protein ABSD59_23570 [Terracidiphilus sp.]|jgi:hypothetical protein